MKVTLKDVGLTTGGLLVGLGVGFIIANKRAEKQLKEHLDTVDKMYAEAFADASARATKSGPYSTVGEAAAVLVPEHEGPDYDAEIQEGGTPSEEDASEESEDDRSPKHLMENYIPTSDEDADEVLRQQHNARLHATVSRSVADDEDPEAINRLEDFVDQYRDRPVAPGGVTYPAQHVFDDDQDDDAEEKTPEEPQSSVPEWKTVRDPNGPYLISIDEYMDQNETPFIKVEMTYFEGDDVLVDIRGEVAPEIDRTVGLNNLDKWGQGTTDADVVYIRNERLEVDIELTRDEGTYSRKILGIIPEDELRRSTFKPLKMRDGDGN